jgi:hypothetical protein
MGALDTAIQPSEHDPSSATASAPDAGTGTPESESPPRRRRTTRVAERLPDTAPRDAAVWVWGALPGTAAGDSSSAPKDRPPQGWSLRTRCIGRVWGWGREGARCRRYARPGRAYCYWHGHWRSRDRRRREAAQMALGVSSSSGGSGGSGGALPAPGAGNGVSLSGKSAPGGRYRGALPPVLREHYEAALRDPERLALGEEIALLDTRLQEVVRAIATEAPAGLWGRFKDVVDEVCLAARRREYGDMLQGLLSLQQMVREGSREASIWEEILSLVERRRVLVESERRRLVDLRQYVTAEKALALVQSIGQVVLQHVPDPVVQRRIASDIEALLHVDPGYTIQPVAIEPLPEEAAGPVAPDVESPLHPSVAAYTAYVGHRGAGGTGGNSGARGDHHETAAHPVEDGDSAPLTGEILTEPEGESSP